jgi:hypothetical protein
VSVLRLLTATTVVAGALVASTALAQDDTSEPMLGRHRHFETPQHFAAEIRFSPFTPNVDSDPALTGKPYEAAFGSSPRVMFGLEVDWQALRIPHLGTLGPGLGAGFVTISDPAPFTDGSGPSAETTSLNIYPFDAVAVFRVDEFWRAAGVPLVPYAKFGFGYALWRASNTLGTSSYRGVVGTGHSIGTHLALGLSFNLNVFDSYAAQNFDDAMGVNGTYVFAEYTREDLDGLGIQKDPLRVGGSNFTFGLAFEF